MNKVFFLHKYFKSTIDVPAATSTKCSEETKKTEHYWLLLQRKLGLLKIFQGGKKCDAGPLSSHKIYRG